MFSVPEYNGSRAAFEGHEVICFLNVSSILVYHILLFLVINWRIFIIGVKIFNESSNSDDKVMAEKYLLDEQMNE